MVKAMKCILSPLPFRSAPPSPSHFWPRTFLLFFFSKTLLSTYYVLASVQVLFLRGALVEVTNSVKLIPLFPSYMWRKLRLKELAQELTVI